VWDPSRCSKRVRDFSGRETLCVFAAIYRATFFCSFRRRRHRGLSSACAWRPHFHTISGLLVSLTRRSWSKSMHPITCRTFSKRRKMTKKPKNADRNRPEMTTPSCFAPDVVPEGYDERILRTPASRIRTQTLPIGPPGHDVHPGPSHSVTRAAPRPAPRHTRPPAAPQ